MAVLRRGTKDSVELGDEIVVMSRKAAKEAAKAEKQVGKAAKADRKAVKKAEKVEKKERSAGGEDGKDAVTGATVKRYIGIARVVVPVVAPLVYQAVGSARARWDEHRARQLGVAPEELSDFTGRGAALYARIHNLAVSTRELGERRSGNGDGSSGGGDTDEEVRTFREQAGGRLADLEAAVRAAEQMPASRRRRAHAAVAAELDRVEARLLTLWGVPGGPDGSGAGAQRAIRS